ncbi:MAG: Bug family tripartite tricarboxylate transporter substrate binding protein [Burkholderiaceae bacterium]
MLSARRVIAVAFAIVLSLGACTKKSSDSAASSYPAKTITFVTPYPAGGASDLIGRRFSELLAKELNTSVIVKNVPGGDTAIGVSEVLGSKADGYTIGLALTTSFAVVPYINKDVSYDAGSPQPIAGLNSALTSFLVKGDAKWDTIESFFSDARKKPNEYKLGTTGLSTSTTLAAKATLKAAGVELTVVPFSGAAEATAALLAGNVDLLVSNFGNTIGMVRAGNMRPLLLITENSKGAFKDVPSSEELGYGRGAPITYSVFGPKGIPEKDLAILVAAAKRVVESADFKKFNEDNFLVTNYMTPDELVAGYKAEAKYYEPFVSKAN